MKDKLELKPWIENAFESIVRSLRLQLMKILQKTPNLQSVSEILIWLSNP